VLDINKHGHPFALHIYNRHFHLIRICWQAILSWIKTFITHLKKLNLSSVLSNIIKSNLGNNLKSLEDEVKSLKKSLKSIREKIKKTVNLYLGDGNNSSKINERTFSLLIQDLEAEEEATLSKLDRLNMEINLQNNFNIDNSVDYVTNHFKDFLSIISDEEKKLLFHSIIKKVHVTKGSRPKERKIKKVIYHFTEDDISNYFKSA